MGIAVNRSNGSYAEPNVIPLIDILLVLLIIFMLASTTLGNIKLNLPMSASKSHSGGSPIVLFLTEDFHYELNGRRIERDHLLEELTSVFEGRPDKLLFITATRSRTYQEVVDAFSTVRQAGVQVLALMPKGL